MATPVQDVSVERLRVTHFDQLLSYIVWAECSGAYYGNKKYFDKRHKELSEWVKKVFLIGIINSIGIING